MNLKQNTLALLMLAIVPAAQCAQVGFSASGTVTNLPTSGNQFVVSLADSLTPLPTGTAIQFGYFTNGFDTTSVGSLFAAGNYSTIYDNFVPFGGPVINSSIIPGRITNTLQITSFGPTRPTNQLAVFVYSTASTNLTPTTQLGIFTATNWVFPGLDAGAGSTVTLQALTNFAFVQLSLKALVGTIDPATGGPGSVSLNLAAIPEPGTLTLAVAGVLAIAGQSRRRK